MLHCLSISMLYFKESMLDCEATIANNFGIFLSISCEVLWDIAGESKNYNMLTGHKNAVLEVKWSPSSGSLISCSADKTVGESFLR